MKTVTITFCSFIFFLPTTMKCGKIYLKKGILTIKEELTKSKVKFYFGANFFRGASLRYISCFLLLLVGNWNDIQKPKATHMKNKKPEAKTERNFEYFLITKIKMQISKFCKQIGASNPFNILIRIEKSQYTKRIKTYSFIRCCFLKEKRSSREKEPPQI